MKLSRTQKILAGIACLALYSIPLATINGAFDIFMKTDGSGIPDGESDGGSFPEYKGWIEIDSFSVGGSAPFAIGSIGGGGGDGKVSLTSMNVTMPVGQTSPGFFNNLTTGKFVAEIKLFMRTPNSSTEFMRIYMKNVFVESMSWSGVAGGDDKPFQSMSLAYQAVKVEYVTFDIKTNAEIDTFSAEWDLASNTATYPTK
ncbi:type VI secretion system tube protein Hcp [Puniceicoccales bacterium CK1056]|uniref:Type VI secretion system tube protein Hcp n=1 Tax=Oceanipulchritudo coccoides TaxID=2706888 RepID=A0A6B2LZV5_9BACT|nr:type VI secretion system tube protein Hcp [Oceanipulchritudo coccoides]NDV61606.1 type VI secretion system tube protein Hcp [Oceanipulchritudo coccoides]